MKKKVDTVKKREISERAVKLYKDWLQTKGTKVVSEMRTLLKEGSKTGGSKNLVECAKVMGHDGQSIMRMFQENWDLFGDTPPQAKMHFMKLLEAESKTKNATGDDPVVAHGIESSYFPIADRSNQMMSQETPNERDLLVQIRNAVSGGNMEIAKALIISGWNSLSLNERNNLIEWVNSMGAYNFEFQGQDYSAPAPSKKTLKMKPMEKRSDMTKSEFANMFTRTALENSKIS